MTRKYPGYMHFRQREQPVKMGKFPLHFGERTRWPVWLQQRSIGLVEGVENKGVTGDKIVEAP